MYEWQEKLLQGFRKGEMMVISAGRQTGKSYVSQLYPLFKNNFYVVDGPVDVDNSPWYTVKCNTVVASWIRTLDKTVWYEHSSTFPMFDVDEATFVMLNLKWK